ncbi:MAG TPA: hypothetical protein VGF91_04665 [Solirubrobacteraceae bacterium]
MNGGPLKRVRTTAPAPRGGVPLPDAPGLIATTPTEERRMREAGLRRANRLAERAQILAHRENDPD